MNNINISIYSEADFDTAEIYRYLGSPHPDDELKKLVNECIDECRGISKCIVTHTLSGVRAYDDVISFDTFSVRSRDLEKNLRSCDRAIIFAATIGLGLDRLISKYAVVSPAKAVIFQAIGAERIESLCDIFNDEIRREFGSLKPRFSPGYGDLSLETQKDIFSLLDCEKRMGLNLNSNLLMSPTKSVTAIIGIKKEVNL